MAYWRKDPKKTADGSASNHGISALKFQLIKEFLLLGHSVLLSDVDIVTLKNPFDHLYRDEDVEALSDGFDEQTAYGWVRCVLRSFRLICVGKPRPCKILSGGGSAHECLLRARIT